jgi:chemotaxis protein CheC
VRFEDLSEADVDRLRELAHIGASWAANALSSLTDRTILTRVPVVHGPERFRKRGEWTTGIFCDLEGSLSGTIGIFLSADSRDFVIRLLCGATKVPEEMRASALCEFGNILASQTASALADTLGGSILPGLPELAADDAESVLQARLAPRHGVPRPIYIESEIFDRGGEIRALHVLVPEVPKG